MNENVCGCVCGCEYMYIWLFFCVEKKKKNLPTASVFATNQKKRQTLLLHRFVTYSFLSFVCRTVKSFKEITEDGDSDCKINDASISNSPSARMIPCRHKSGAYCAVPASKANRDFLLSSRVKKMAKVWIIWRHQKVVQCKASTRNARTYVSMNRSGHHIGGELALEGENKREEERQCAWHETRIRLIR